MQNLEARGLARAGVLALLLGLSPAAMTAATIAPDRTGAQAFDWEMGTWRTQVKRRVRPLSGSQEWVEYTGTSVVRPVLDGRANLVELRVEGKAGRIEGASLRLFDPRTGQWSLNYASAHDGTLTPPVVGAFRNGRGEFFGMEQVDGRPVLVRFVISGISADAASFEQAYSLDGGQTWETNWIATDRRIRAPG